MLLTYIVAELTFIACMMWHGRLNKSAPYESALAMIIIAPTFFLTVRLWVLQFSPHALASVRLNNVSHSLLNCLENRVPVDMGAMKRCVSSADVYNVTKSRMPYTTPRWAPIAFVAPTAYSNSVFVMGDYYYKLNDIEQALILIHECTHLTLDTHDYAYRWQSEFDTLTDAQHTNNADSYVDAIVRYCVRPSRV